MFTSDTTDLLEQKSARNHDSVFQTTSSSCKKAGHHNCNKCNSITQAVKEWRGHIYTEELQLIHWMSLDFTEQQ